MSRYCCVCEVVEQPLDKSRRFHKFPKNEQSKGKWLAAIGKESVAKRATICSDHSSEFLYHPNDDYPSDKRLLKTGAVPNRNLPSPTSSLMELNGVQDLQIENDIRKNHKTLTSIEGEKLGSDDSCSTEIIDTGQSSTNALHSTLGVSVANEFNAQMD
ncbi:hypothetical protein QAD02_002332 [Eretmocerus hayati]|uniref:Uncharacterized protein n=1 Tax=Eretmocerus hayati TaxID=131215 RepID=A0ACC2NJT7_9HYME|nr:hypothetical protein QAD02_002332 [Eretmocerus hayati]